MLQLNCNIRCQPLIAFDIFSDFVVTKSMSRVGVQPNVIQLRHKPPVFNNEFGTAGHVLCDWMLKFFESASGPSMRASGKPHGPLASKMQQEQHIRIGGKLWPWKSTGRGFKVPKGLWLCSCSTVLAYTPLGLTGKETIVLRHP